MISKALGSILLIVGTSVGGAILALPMVTSGAGLIPSLFLLFFVWALMTLAALCVLEVSLHLPAGNNLVSMSEYTLGPYAKWLTWSADLLLLYALIAAYLAGGADVVANLLALFNIHLPPVVNSLIFLLPISAMINQGIRCVDLTNRGLMGFKLFTLVLLIALLMPSVESQHIVHTDWSSLSIALAPVITAFGYAIITPSLRAYCDDGQLLRKVVLIGSLIPLFCYVFWLLAIHGSLGSEELSKINQSEHAVSDLIDALSAKLSNHSIGLLPRLFISVSIVTSFLGISLSLRDFLLDGLHIEHNHSGRVKSIVLTFLPPFLILHFRPDVFILALSYAGMVCIVLLMLMPFAMAYRLRESGELSSEKSIVPVSQKCLLMCMALGVALLFASLYL